MFKALRSLCKEKGNVVGRWGPEDNVRPRTPQMTKINMRKIKPSYSDAICNLMPDFFFQQSLSCSGRECHRASLCRAVHPTGKYVIFSPQNWYV